MMATRLNSKPAAALTTISKRKVIELPLSLSLSSSSDKDDKNKRVKRDMSKPGAFSVLHVCEIGCEHTVAVPIEQPAGLFDYTAYPYKLAVENIEKVRALVGEATSAHASLNGAQDGGKLLKQLGERVFKLTGLRDASFFGTLLPPGTRALYVRALCPLREKTLEDGAETVSGGVIHAYAKALDLGLVVSNIAMHCWRQGKDGVEPGHGQAGCRDLHGKDLEVCTLVKELHFIGILAAGIIPVAVLSSSNCAMESFGSSPKEVVHFEPQAKFHGVDVYFVYHLKYASQRCWFNSSVALAFECTRSEVPARYVDGFARMGARIMGKTGDKELEKQIYESMRGNEDADLCLPAWEDCMKSEMTPAYKEKLLLHRKLWGYSKEGWVTAKEGRYRQTFENSLKVYDEYRYTEKQWLGMKRAQYSKESVAAAIRGEFRLENDYPVDELGDVIPLMTKLQWEGMQHAGFSNEGIAAARRNEFRLKNHFPLDALGNVIPLMTEEQWKGSQCYSALAWANARKELYSDDAPDCKPGERMSRAQHLAAVLGRAKSAATQKANYDEAHPEFAAAFAAAVAALNPHERDPANIKHVRQNIFSRQQRYASALKKGATFAFANAVSCPDSPLLAGTKINSIIGHDHSVNPTNFTRAVLYVTAAGLPGKEDDAYYAPLNDVVISSPELLIDYAKMTMKDDEKVKLDCWIKSAQIAIESRHQFPLPADATILAIVGYDRSVSRSHLNLPKGSRKFLTVYVWAAGPAGVGVFPYSAQLNDVLERSPGVVLKYAEEEEIDCWIARAEKVIDALKRSGQMLPGHAVDPVLSMSAAPDDVENSTSQNISLRDDSSVAPGSPCMPSKRRFGSDSSDGSDGSDSSLYECTSDALSSGLDHSDGGAALAADDDRKANEVAQKKRRLTLTPTEE